MNKIITISSLVTVFPEVKGFLSNPASINIASPGNMSIEEAEMFILDIQKAIDILKK